MSLSANDAIIKTAIELSIDDLIKNPAIIDDIFSVYLTNPYLKNKYGAKEISRAREFLLNNKINIYLKHRIDNQDFPCITIALGSSVEDKSLATLADQSTCVEELDPCAIGKPIPFIVNPFKLDSYDKETGAITIPSGIKNCEYIGVGMLVVDPKSGGAFKIEKVSNGAIFITPDSNIDFDEIAIAPQFAFYRARRERIISQESYNIGCHTHGDPATLQFLYGVVKYALLRYREGLLEYNNFQISNLSSTDMIKNEAFGADNVYSRFITLQGQVEEYWLKEPQRIVEVIDFKDKNKETGLKIISNENTNPNSEESENDVWVTIDDLD